MNNIDYGQFKKDYVDTVFENNFDENDWRNFLGKYFSDKVTQEIHNNVWEDVSFFREHDPASKNYINENVLSVRLSMKAVLSHRIFEKMLTREEKALLEIERLATIVQAQTNIEIHPLAKINKNFAIDHGSGTVIGATAEIGENVFIYHGVTLGASTQKDANNRRHPKIENDVFLGNGVQILGPSIIKNNVTIGAGAMIIDSIIGDKVKISPNVQISKVKVPSSFQIMSFDSLTQKFIGRKPESNLIESFSLEKISLADFD